MYRMALPVAVVAGLAGCTQLLGVNDVTVQRRIGGQVRGLWGGADGVVLRLQAQDTDALLKVAANDAFQFAERFPPGTSYTVTVATNPVQHACVVDGGGKGMVTDDDVTSVSVACTGPASITLSGPWGWTFDPTQETQTFTGSIATQSVVLTIIGSELSGASMNGTPASPGLPTPALALPLGKTVVPVAVFARSGLAKTYQLVFDRGGSVLEQVVYSKASNTGAGDSFGYSVTLSGDTLAVGAPYESSNAVGVNPVSGQADNSANGAGAVYVFVRTGTTWSQQAYLKASNTDASDRFGVSVALSGDTLAVGADGEASGAVGVNPPGQADNSVNYAGAVYVFVRTGTMWTQQAYLKASNTDAFDFFGASVALSGDTLAVGAANEDSGTVGVNPANGQADNSASDAGAVYVFVRTGTTWTQQAYLKASNTGAGDVFGRSVALSGDTLAVGATGEASGAVGVNPAGGQADNSADNAGAVYVFVRTGTTWTQQAYLKASNTEAQDIFGDSIALSGDTLAVGAYGEASGAIGINPPGRAYNSAALAGAVYVFVRTGTTWTQQAYLKASNTDAFDFFGASVALSGDMLAVGAYSEDSGAVGVNPPGQADNSLGNAGAVYVFVRTGTMWTQQAYLKASNTGVDDLFGFSVALSGDTLAVGADLEASGATGVNPPGGQADNRTSGAGAVYVFR
jgi:FG-GAP repeat protein